MSTSRKRKREKAEILFCGHSSWVDDQGMTTIPEDTYLYIYAPLGAALSQAVPRALVSGENINKGDLTIKRISPITLFNYGYEDRGNFKDNYEARPHEMLDYPILLKPDDSVPNYFMSSPGTDSLQANEESNIVVNNIGIGTSLADLLKENKGNTCHFGGCSWIRQDNDRRDLVTFNDNKKQDKFTVKLSEAEKKAKRLARFRTTEN